MDTTRESARIRSPQTADLTREEVRSLTHGEFWIPEDERVVYQSALRTLYESGVPYVTAGLYAIYEYTGIYRQTKDLDLFFEPSAVLPAARALRDAGFVMRLEDPHWLAKAKAGEHFIDIIFAMGNGVAVIDEGWIANSQPGILAATPVRIAPAEELIWHRLFISERHRHDMSDIVHLMLCLGDTLDWERLIMRVGEHWPLLLSQVLMFNYVYPGYRSNIPRWVPERLLERARAEIGRNEENPDFTRGPLISQFSFMIDVREWGFLDPRARLVRAARNRPDIRAIAGADVWQERGDDRRAENRDDTTAASATTTTSTT